MLSAAVAQQRDFTQAEVYACHHVDLKVYTHFLCLETKKSINFAVINQIKNENIFYVFDFCSKRKKIFVCKKETRIFAPAF